MVTVEYFLPYIFGYVLVLKSESLLAQLLDDGCCGFPLRIAYMATPVDQLDKKTDVILLDSILIDSFGHRGPPHRNR